MRSFCIASIGVIFGIIMGLYLQSIVLFLLLILYTTIFLTFFKNKRKYFIIFMVSFIIFYSYITLLEKNYSQKTEFYANKEITIEGIVVSKPTEKEYKNVYEVKVVQIGNTKENFKILCNIKQSKNMPNISLQYGDKITFKAILEEPSTARNEGGFDYKQYLRSQQILGSVTITLKDIQVLENNKMDFISTNIHKLKNYLIQIVKNIMPQETAGVCIALLLGEKNLISEEIQNNFRESSLSHALAISGAHISYILLGITSFLKYIKLHRKISIIISILFLIFYMVLVGFTPSVTRACIMAILTLLADFFFQKSDVYQNLAISSIFILAINPYSLLDIGFQLSFGGTIGIVLFMNNETSKNENKTYLKKITNYIKQILKVSLAANLIILPIMIYHFNTLSATFLISNLLASPILGISLISGMVFLIFILVFKPFALGLSYFVNIILQLFIQIAEFCSQLPFSQILLPTPKIWQILLYYILLFTIFKLKKKHVVNNKIKDITKITAISKTRNFLKKYQKLIIILQILILISPYFIKQLPTTCLKINFIDVGQGDSMLIQTPSKKTILIDGGGSEIGSFDVGKNTLLPYLLDKNITKIDYIMFTHFDTDHAQGLLTILENLKVKNVIISKQGENSNNFTEFLRLIEKKNVNVIIVKAGNRIHIDKDCYFDILFPTDELISNNVLNNNSIVAKFYMQNYFSMLLTGDIEQIAEEKIIEKYKNTNMLKSTALKVAHHGSKSSSIQEFLDLVKPKIALIGVGAKNTFGHPNEGVLKRLTNLRCKNF